jgi:hypothetical protein
VGGETKVELRAKKVDDQGAALELLPNEGRLARGPWPEEEEGLLRQQFVEIELSRKVAHER